MNQNDQTHNLFLHFSAKRNNKLFIIPLYQTKVKQTDWEEGKAKLCSDLIPWHPYENPITVSQYA